MKELIMLLCGILFMVLFGFLFFIFGVFILSVFRKKKYGPFQPEVTVLIPAFNEEKNIGECLDSVFGSDYLKEKLTYCRLKKLGLRLSMIKRMIS